MNEDLKSLKTALRILNEVKNGFITAAQEKGVLSEEICRNSFERMRDLFEKINLENRYNGEIGFVTLFISYFEQMVISYEAHLATNMSDPAP